MRLFRTATLLSSLLFAVIVNAQTTDEIINKHINAIGGNDVISKITSQITYSDVFVQGSALKIVSTMLTGKGFKSVSKIEGQEIIQCITPTGGWSFNPIAGMVDPAPLPKEQVKAGQFNLQPGGELYDYKTKGNNVELIGREMTQGVNAFKLKLVNKDGDQTSTYFISPSTYYIIKRVVTVTVNGRQITITSTFTGFTKTEIGLVMPFSTATDAQGTKITVTITKVEFNKEVDMKIFEMPG